MTRAYPLQWPVGKPRTSYPGRSKFKIGFWDTTKTLLEEIRRLGGTNLVISTNVELRQDGLPYANRRQPEDRGAAVYFTHKGKAMCFACDKWDEVGHNVYAIAKTIEALRGIERWGTGDMVEQAFSGFTALPAPKSCWDILNIPATSTPEEINSVYKRKAQAAHPDRPGGSHELMAELNSARDRALASWEGAA